MRTKLPSSITTVDEAKQLLEDLFNNHEDFHPDDPAEDIIPGKHTRNSPYGMDKFLFTLQESKRLNILMGQVCSLDNFDPYGYFIDLYKIRYARECKNKKSKNLIN